MGEFGAASPQNEGNSTHHTFYVFFFARCVDSKSLAASCCCFFLSDPSPYPKRRNFWRGAGASAESRSRAGAFDPNFGVSGGVGISSRDSNSRRFQLRAGNGRLI